MILSIAVAIFSMLQHLSTQEIKNLITIYFVLKIFRKTSRNSIHEFINQNFHSNYLKTLNIIESKLYFSLVYFFKYIELMA